MVFKTRRYADKIASELQTKLVSFLWHNNSWNVLAPVCLLSKQALLSTERLECCWNCCPNSRTSATFGQSAKPAQSAAHFRSFSFQEDHKSLRDCNATCDKLLNNVAKKFGHLGSVIWICKKTAIIWAHRGRWLRIRCRRTAINNAENFYRIFPREAPFRMAFGV